jgi:hypothetical protein
MVVVLAVSALGCGQRTATLSGKVTYQGKPLTSGVVVFVNEEGKVSPPAAIGSDGNYVATQVPLGQVKISIDNPPPAGLFQSSGGNKPAETDPELMEAREKAATYVAIPPRYKDPQQAGRLIEVSAGSSSYDIDLD